MRFVEIFTEGLAASVSSFLHGSRHALASGVILTPRGDTMAGVDEDVETVLEAARPAACPRRGDVIYMARTLRTLENVCRDADFIYRVDPIGAVLRLDASWINRLWKLFAAHEEELDAPEVVARAKRYAEGYWSGRSCPAFEPGHEAIWEYMAPQARILGMLKTTTEDQQSSAIDESFAPPVRWQWTDRRNIEYVAVFKIGMVIYTVSCFRYDSTDDSWELSFTAETKTEDFGFRTSNTGNAWKVFGTVIDIARQFIATRKPNILKIESDPTERSRLAVNRRLAAAIAHGSPYTVSMTEGDDILLQRQQTVTEASPRAKKQEILVIVHPDSACGSADFNLGADEAARDRAQLVAEIQAWRGGVIILDGAHTEELGQPAYRLMRTALERAFAHAQTHRLLAVRQPAPDPQQIAVIKRVAASLDPTMTQFRLTGAWYHRDDGGGCIGSVRDALLALGFRTAVSETALWL